MRLPTTNTIAMKRIKQTTKIEMKKIEGQSAGFVINQVIFGQIACFGEKALASENNEKEERTRIHGMGGMAPPTSQEQTNTDRTGTIDRLGSKLISHGKKNEFRSSDKTRTETKQNKQPLLVQVNWVLDF